MSFLDAVGSFITGGASSLVELASRAWSVIQTLWSLVGAVFSHVGEAWGDLYQAAKALGQAEVESVLGAYTAVKWITEHGLPGAVSYVFNTVVPWVEKRAAEVEHTAEVALDDAAHDIEHWTAGLVSDLEHEVAVVEKTASGAWSFVQGAGVWLFNVVSHPERLVLWLLPSFGEPFLRWVSRESSPLIRWFVRNARGLSLDFSEEIEDAAKELI